MARQRVNRNAPLVHDRETMLMQQVGRFRRADKLLPLMGATGQPTQYVLSTDDSDQPGQGVAVERRKKLHAADGSTRNSVP